MGMGMLGAFGADFGAFGAESWGVGRKIGRQAVPGRGGFCGVRRRKARPLPCRSAPKAFFGPARGGAGPRWDRVIFLGRQDGAASIGATQRIKTIAFWAIYTYSNTYWRLKGSKAQMPKKLTITVDVDVYEGLHTVIGRRRISRFLNDLARPHVVRQNLAAGYAAMAADEAREAAADAWSEGVLEDVADEPRRDR